MGDNSANRHSCSCYKLESLSVLGIAAQQAHEADPLIEDSIVAGLGYES